MHLKGIWQNKVSYEKNRLRHNARIEADQKGEDKY